MEMNRFFPVLLLVCTVSAAQLQESENDIISNDIDAVLREMGAWLAALKVEVKHLQRDNEVAQERQMIELRQPQAAELATVQAKVDNAENQVEALKREGEAKRLAFSASFLALTPGNFGPFNTHTTLVFRHVVTNVGNAYNPHTGLFTAPVRGAYHFEFYIYGHGSSNPTSAVLVKNREQIFTAWTTQPEGGQKTSNGVTLLLNVGDVVFLRMWANSRIHDNPDRHNTFSGHLLFTI
uniref:C1q domain-containing protein n=1 Tax=Poecilia formosa TaxID=48698 RepID=A0A087XN19_POEFO